MSRTRIRWHARAWASALALATVTAGAAPYVAYEGVYPVKVLDVEGPGRVIMDVPVWTGFVRRFAVSLPDVTLPRIGDGAPACEQAAARAAREFSQSYLARADKVTVRDIRMDDTAKNEAAADILTSSGSLADALVAHGYARRGAPKPGVPWCR